MRKGSELPIRVRHTISASALRERKREWAIEWFEDRNRYELFQSTHNVLVASRGNQAP